MAKHTGYKAISRKMHVFGVRSNFISYHDPGGCVFVDNRCVATVCIYLHKNLLKILIVVNVISERACFTQFYCIPMIQSESSQHILIYNIYTFAHTYIHILMHMHLFWFEHFVMAFVVCVRLHLFMICPFSNICVWQ